MKKRNILIYFFFFSFLLLLKSVSPVSAECKLVDSYPACCNQGVDDTVQWWELWKDDVTGTVCANFAITGCIYSDPTCGPPAPSPTIGPTPTPAPSCNLYNTYQVCCNQGVDDTFQRWEEWRDQNGTVCANFATTGCIPGDPTCGPATQACTPGAYDNRCTGNCAGCAAGSGEEEFRQCDASGQWGNWGDPSQGGGTQCSTNCGAGCTGGVCTPGAYENRCTGACGGCASNAGEEEFRQCDASGQWGNWGDPSQGGGTQCSTSCSGACGGPSPTSGGPSPTTQPGTTPTPYPTSPPPSSGTGGVSCPVPSVNPVDPNCYTDVNTNPANGFQYNVCIGCATSNSVCQNPNTGAWTFGAPQCDEVCRTCTWCPEQIVPINKYCVGCNKSYLELKNICTGETSQGPVQDDFSGDCGGAWCTSYGGAGGGGGPPPGCVSPIQTGTGFKCAAVGSGLGNVNVEQPKSFITQLFSIILGIAGVITLILLIYAGYLLVTSAGDKQKVHQAREVITSAVAGLLFLIFSIVLLEVIGVDILKIFNP